VKSSERATCETSLMTRTLSVDLQTAIETPENAVLTFRLAGPGSRMAAYLVDLALRIGIVYAASVALSYLGPVIGFGGGLPMGGMLLLLFFVEWGYGCVLEGLWNGRTPGKAALGIRVVRTGGFPIGFYDAMVRNLLRAADALPLFYGVGLLAMFFNARMQRLGDLVAGTMVVRERREELRGPPPALASAVPFERSEVDFATRPPERTLELIERLFDRAEQLGTARFEEIAGHLARPLAARLRYDGDVMAGPSDFLLRTLRTFSEPAAVDGDEATLEAVAEVSG